MSQIFCIHCGTGINRPSDATVVAVECGSCGREVRLPDSAEAAPVASSQMGGGASVIPESPSAGTVPEIEPEVASVAPPVADRQPVPGLSIGDALAFPFRQPRWPLKLSWVLLFYFLAFAGIGVFMLRGWRLSVVRRIARGEADQLPEASELGRFLVDGIILWTMTFVYHIPTILLIGLFAWSELAIAVDVLTSFYSIISGEGLLSFLSLLFGVFMALLIAAGGPAAYALAVWPIYRAGMIRFALSGKVSSFFNVPRNIAVVVQNATGFAVAFFYWIVSVNVMVLLIPTLTATIGGIVLLPFVSLILSFTAPGYLYGQLGLRVAARGVDGSPDQRLAP